MLKTMRANVSRVNQSGFEVEDLMLHITTAVLVQFCLSLIERIKISNKI